MSDLRRALSSRTAEDTHTSPRQLGVLLRLVDEGVITRTAARDVLAELLAHGGDTEAIVHTRGLATVSDEATLAPHVDAVIAAFPEQADAYRGGKTGLIGFFTGEAMRRAGKGADPKRVQVLLRERLGG